VGRITVKVDEPHIYDVLYGDELQGINVLDLESLTYSAPKLEGQIHLVMTDVDQDRDDLYFKHYAATDSERHFV
jgi:hypothetical protein